MIRVPSQARAGIAAALAACLSSMVEPAHLDAIIWLVWLLGGLIDYAVSGPDRDGDGVPDALATLARARGIDPVRLATWLRTASDAEILLDAVRRELGGRAP